MVKPKYPERKIWRPTQEDWKLMKELQAKLGVSDSDVIRMGLRKLADAEGVTH